MNRVIKSFFIALSIFIIFYLSLFVLNPQYAYENFYTQGNFILIFIMFFGLWFVAYVWPELQKAGFLNPKKTDNYYLIFIALMGIIIFSITILIFKIEDPAYNWLLALLILVLMFVFGFFTKRYN